MSPFMAKALHVNNFVFGRSIVAETRVPYFWEDNFSYSSPEESSCFDHKDNHVLFCVSSLGGKEIFSYFFKSFLF